MKAYYAGKWQATRPGGQETSVCNPYTGEVIDTVPRLDGSILAEVMPSLQREAKSLAVKDRGELFAIFQRLHAVMESRKEELARMIVCEHGKPVVQAESEVANALASCRVLAFNSSLAGAEIMPIPSEAKFGNRYGFTVRHPHGVVAALTPSPQPLILPVVATLYALAAGNAVLLKPSRHTPLIALTLVEMLLEAGCPPNAIACVTGHGDKLGRAICNHPGIHHVFCRGRLKTIRDIRASASFFTTELQWSCVSSCVVMKTGKLEQVADKIVSAAFENAGQSAFCPTWVAVHQARHEELRELLRLRIEGLRIGDPMDRTTDLGPITAVAMLRRLRRRVDHELNAGAEIVCGGVFNEQAHRRRVVPLLLDKCGLKTTRFCRQEVSGPILGITKVSGSREATLQLASQRFHVLTFFTGDENWAIREAMRLPFDNIHINGIPAWTDGLICIPGNPVRAGRSSAEGRVHRMSHIRDVICHE
ncbi:MAG: aldehyde dehydrogenase family protein [Rhizobiales bacterium]|nr:aldehyde dehydrogenase family protein [Hyphomicrobiales bacterium]